MGHPDQMPEYRALCGQAMAFVDQARSARVLNEMVYCMFHVDLWSESACVAGGSLGSVRASTGTLPGPPFTHVAYILNTIDDLGHNRRACRCHPTR